MDPILAARNALEAVFEVVPRERLLIINDASRADVASAFTQGGISAGLWVRQVPLDPPTGVRKTISTSLASTIVESRADILLNFLRGHGEETPFRVQLVQLEQRRKPRIGHCPGTTLDMLTEGALAMTIEEHRAMQTLANRLIGILQGCASIHVTTPAGTDCTVGVEGRTWWTETRIDWKTMKWMNLPTGEVLVGPVETGPGAWTGTFVCDAAIGGWPGGIPSPITLHAREGHVDRIECDNPGLLERVQKTLAIDEWASHIGEFAFGINPKARIHEEFIETEKCKTVHLAVGHNLDYPGIAHNASQTHLDFLVQAPTVIAMFSSGEEKVIMRDGNYMV